MCRIQDSRLPSGQGLMTITERRFFDDQHSGAGSTQNELLRELREKALQEVCFVQRIQEYAILPSGGQK